MRPRRRFLHTLPMLAVVSLMALVVAGPREASGTTEGVPDSMAAMGDSITVAVNADPGGGFNQPQNSWSTGTSSTVMSQYSRILQSNPAISGRNHNMAVSGAQMVDLNGQAMNVNAIAGGVEYVTILMGANDVCTSTEAAMTPVATFRSQFVTGMNTLTAGSPNPRVLQLSIPDVYILWEVLHTNASARFIWALAGICQSLLVNANSTAQADVDRRARVRQRNIDFNTQLAEVCALYPQCKFDDNAAFNYQFVPSQISTVDYFHPSLAGQAVLAAESWKLFDMDADAWSSGAEGIIGTDPLDDCTDDPSDNAHPADFNNDTFFDITDIGTVAGSFGEPVATATARKDIAPDPPDGFVDITDVGAVAGRFGTGCGP